MIRVKGTVRQGRFQELLVQGHAGQNEIGKDLVCAGVSCIAIGTNNALDEMASGTFYTQTKEGYLRIQIMNDQNQEAQIILKTAWIQLEAIADSYPKFIEIKKQEV